MVELSFEKERVPFQKEIIYSTQTFFSLFSPSARASLFSFFFRFSISTGTADPYIDASRLLQREGERVNFVFVRIFYVGKGEKKVLTLHTLQGLPHIHSFTVQPTAGFPNVHDCPAFLGHHFIKLDQIGKQLESCDQTKKMQ